MIQELAENANTYVPLGPGEERIEAGRYVIWLGRLPFAAWTVVQRLRLAGDEVETALQEIRALLRERSRTGCTWEVADGATPPGLADRLLELGLRPAAEPLAIGMVLDHEPLGGRPAGVEVRGAESVGDLRESVRIAGAAFGMAPEELEAAVEAVDGRPDTPDTVTYLALVDGRPVAQATATFTPHGALLFGGATLEAERGRGAYRALVRARWDDAVARGTPVLVTHAGAMSRPILERLGFRARSRIRILVDDF